MEELAEKAESAMHQGSMICNAKTSSGVKGVKWQLALGLLVEMVESTVQQTSITCNAAISACGRGVSQMAALSLTIKDHRCSDH